MTVETAQKPQPTTGPPAEGQVAHRQVDPARLLGVAPKFMVILDLSIVNVALPHIQDALNISFGQPALGRRRLRDPLRQLPDARRAGRRTSSGSGGCSSRR